MNTTYWLNNIMSTMYTNNATGFYVGLSSSEPTVAGAGFTEPSGGNYSRVKIASFTAPTNGVVKNGAAITFPQSSQTWFESDAKATIGCCLMATVRRQSFCLGARLMNLKQLKVTQPLRLLPIL